jgi:hypothetical protein
MTEVPSLIAERASSWKFAFMLNIVTHWVVGIGGVLASVVAAAGLSSGVTRTAGIMAALCVGVLGFVRPEQMYQRYVRAWRILDSACLRYSSGLIDLETLHRALEHGEAAIQADETDRSTPPAGGKPGANP